MSALDLLRDGPVIVNVGVRAFAEALADQGATVLQVEWTPTRTLDLELSRLLDRLG
jgi:hypothetical protein